MTTSLRENSLSHLQEMESNASSRNVGDELSPAIVFWSSGGRIHHANRSFCKLVGYSVDELRVDQQHSNAYQQMPEDAGSSKKEKIGIYSLFHPEEMVNILKRQLEAVQHNERSSYQLKTRLLSKINREIPVSVSISNLRDTLGIPLLTVAHFVTV